MACQRNSAYLHAMRKIQKERKWMMSELIERQMKNPRAISKMLLLQHERASGIKLLQAVRSEHSSRIPNTKHHGFHL